MRRGVTVGATELGPQALNGCRSLEAEEVARDRGQPRRLPGLRPGLDSPYLG